MNNSTQIYKYTQTFTNIHNYTKPEQKYSQIYRYTQTYANIQTHTKTQKKNTHTANTKIDNNIQKYIQIRNHIQKKKIYILTVRHK